MIPDFKVFLQYFSKETIQMIRYRDMIGVTRDIYANSKNEGLKRDILRHIQSSLRPHEELNVDLLLELYFLQVSNPRGFFLDMRASPMEIKNGQFSWDPQPWIYKFSPRFSKGIQKIYRGFFLDQPELLSEGIDETSLLPRDVNAKQKQEFTELLMQHFGDVKSKKVSFTLTEFSKSFHHVFMFFKRYGLSVPSDFVILGCMLTSLYWSLEKFKEPADVSAAYKSVTKTLALEK